MIRTENLTKEHIEQVLVNLRPQEKHDMGHLDIVIEHLTQGKSLAWAVVDDKTVAIGGIREMWRGVGEAWMIRSADLEKYSLPFHRVSKALIKAAEREGFHRLQCTVNAEDDISLKWIESLGFWVEGTLEKYSSDGKHHYAYARVI